MRYRTAMGIGFAVVATGAIYVLPVYQAWVYQFQTLITGLLAVAAAYLAINQSRAVELSSERRHQQLIELTLRPVRLMIDRTVFPMVEYIEDALEDIEQLKHSISQDEGAWILMIHRDEVKRNILSWHEIVHNDQLDIAKDYFEGHMVHALARARSATAALIARMSIIDMELPMVRNTENLHGEVPEFLVEPAEFVKRNLIALLEFLSEFRDGLRSLEKDYLKSKSNYGHL